MRNQKGLAPLVVIVILVLMLAGIGGGYYFGKHQASRVSNQEPSIVNVSQSSLPSSTPAPSLAAKSPAAMIDFPIYPGAQFLKKDLRQDCRDYEGPPNPSCNNDAYTFTVHDTFAHINQWYHDQPSLKFIGGAGETDNEHGSGTSTWSKNGINYDVTILGNSDPATLVIYIPPK